MSRTDAIDDAGAVARAGDKAGAADIVGALPEGLRDDCWVGCFKGGRQLSGGQWQRLALARLYFRDASVLIFDEPTAALDANAEFEVIETLRKNALGRINRPHFAPLFDRAFGGPDYRARGRRPSPNRARTRRC